MGNEDSSRLIELHEEFDKFAEAYRDIHTRNVQSVSGEDSTYFAEYKIKEIRARFGKLKGSFLDLGCGDGITAEFVNKYFPAMKYDGIDISEKSVEIANSRKTLSSSFRVYDGYTIPFKNNTFDVVFMACVLHHILPSKRRRIIRECRRVLKPGGKLIIFEHNTYNPVTRKVVNDCIFDEDAILLSSREAERRMRQARMHNIECRYTIFFPRKGIFTKFVPLEKYLSKIPLGGQYYITSEK